jgi:hypothetical protein
MTFKMSEKLLKLTQFTQNRCVKLSTTTLNGTLSLTYYGVNVTLQYYIYLSREIKRSNLRFTIKVYRTSLPYKKGLVSR